MSATTAITKTLAKMTRPHGVSKVQGNGDGYAKLTDPENHPRQKQREEEPWLLVGQVLKGGHKVAGSVEAPPLHACPKRIGRNALGQKATSKHGRVEDRQ